MEILLKKVSQKGECEGVEPPAGLPKYNILPHTYKQAKRLGVEVFPSDNPKYKIEVYDGDKLFVTYAGARGYADYPHYIQSHGKEYADKRRRLYKIRPI